MFLRKTILIFFIFFSIAYDIYGQHKIIWNKQSLTKISSSEKNERYCGYARMLELQDQSWLCIYEADGHVVSVKSNDKGGTWTKPVMVAAKTNAVNMAAPDLLALKDQSILAMYNPRPFLTGEDFYFSIKIKRSEDGGFTWKDERLLYQADNKFENGCWEPSAIQLPNGEIQLFFANEDFYRDSEEQNISLLKSYDNGLSWSKEPLVISFRENSRDGMPVPLLLHGSDSIAVAIEDNGNKNFKPYIIKNSINQDWQRTVTADSKYRSYALKETLADSIYAGAPYLRQLKSGETILAYQGTEGRTNKMRYAEMKVTIGDEQASNFGNKSVPFEIPGDKYALWNSMMIADDDTIVAITSTNAFGDGRTEVWMIKGRLVTSEVGL